MLKVAGAELLKVTGAGVLLATSTIVTVPEKSEPSDIVMVGVDTSVPAAALSTRETTAGLREIVVGTGGVAEIVTASDAETEAPFCVAVTVHVKTPSSADVSVRERTSEDIAGSHFNGGWWKNVLNVSPMTTVPENRDPSDMVI